MAPNTPNARPRSFDPLNVVVSRDSAEGAMKAPNAPCSARAATSMLKLVAAPADGGRGGEADQAAQEGDLAAQQEETRPPSSSRLPKASAYAVTTHCRSTC